MSEKTTNPDFIDAKTESKEHKKTSLRELVDGSIITRSSFAEQLPFMLFVALLAIIYIGNRFHAEKIYRDASKLREEVKDLRAQSITTASQLMFVSKQSEVIKNVRKQGLDLEESTKPPYKIQK